MGQGRCVGMVLQANFCSHSGPGGRGVLHLPQSSGFPSVSHSDTVAAAEAASASRSAASKVQLTHHEAASASRSAASKVQLTHHDQCTTCLPLAAHSQFTLTHYCPCPPFLSNTRLCSPMRATHRCRRCCSRGGRRRGSSSSSSS